MGAPHRTSTLTRRGPSPAARSALVIGFPVLAGLLVLAAPDRVDVALAGLLGLGLIVLVARAPELAVLSLPALLPFQQVLLALLLQLGAPEGAVRGLGFWKEGVAAGLVAAAVVRAREVGGRLDAVDLVALGLVANNVLYRLLPKVFVPQAEVPDVATLNLALRSTSVFLVLFVAARRLDLDGRLRERFARVLLLAGGAVAAIGVVEHLFSDLWNAVAVDVLDIPHYRRAVLDVSVANPLDIRVYTEVAGRHVIRIGSVFFDQLACGLFLVIVLAIALEHLARDHGPRWTGALAPLVGTAIVLTQTRAAVLGAAACILLALRPAPGRDPRSRERVGLAVAAAVVLLLPVAVSTGLATRALDTIGAKDRSTQEHQARTSEALRRLVDEPLGSGLGTTSEIARRAGVENPRYTEDYYLEVGGETGVQAMALFVALTISCVVLLQRRTHAAAPGSRDPAGERGDPTAAAWRGGLVGLGLAALLLPVWIDLAVAWPFWVGAGLAIGAPSTPGAAARTVP